MRKESVDIGTILNTSFRAIGDANPRLRGVFQDVDFANKERFPDHLLDSLLQHFEKHRMRKADVDSTVLRTRSKFEPLSSVGDTLDGLYFSLFVLAISIIRLLAL